MTPEQQYQISQDLDNWLEKYGSVLSFSAKQALIPIRNALFSIDYYLSKTEIESEK